MLECRGMSAPRYECRPGACRIYVRAADLGAGAHVQLSIQIDNLVGRAQRRHDARRQRGVHLVHLPRRARGRVTDTSQPAGRQAPSESTPTSVAVRPSSS